MPHCLNLSVVLRYDFIVTYLAIIFFVNWIRTILQLNKLNYVFRRVWKNRNIQIHRRRSWPVQTPK